MSSPTSVVSSPGHDTPSRERNAALAGTSPWDYVGIMFLTVGLLALYLPTLAWLNFQWGHDEYFGHGPLVPFLCIFLVSLRWHQIGHALQEDSGSSARRFPWLLLVALGLAFVGGLGYMNSVKALGALSIPLALLGVTGWLVGPATTRSLRVPALFFLTAVPFSGPLVELLTLPMQNVAARCAALVLGLSGLKITREGINLYTNNFKFVVEVPCSGLKTAITLLTLGVLMACIIPNLHRWQRYVLVLLCLPIAVVANTFRVAAIILIGCNWGEKAAGGFLHGASGLLMFGLAIILVLMTGEIFRASNRGSGPRRNPAGNIPGTVLPHGSARAIPPHPLRRLAAAQVILARRRTQVGLAALLVWGVWGGTRAVLAGDQGGGLPAVTALKLPAKFGAWRGEDVAVSRTVYDVLHPDAVVQKCYTLGEVGRGTPGHPPVKVMVLAVYSRNPSGLHSPVVCLRAMGWTLLSQEEKTVTSGGRSLHVNVLTGQQEARAIQLAYTFSDPNESVRGRVPTFVKLLVSRMLRNSAGAVTMQFGYSAGALNRDGSYSEPVSDLMITMNKIIHDQLKSSSPQVTGVSG